MPFFGSKFSPKKPPSRKSSATTTTGEQLEEMVSDDRAVKLKLGDQEAVFKDGEWMQGIRVKIVAEMWIMMLFLL